MIPLVDLKAQYQSIKDEIDNAIERVINNATFIGGEEVFSFEREFALHVGISHCVACGNGTDAIEILLKAMGIGLGDEVLVPAISWIATSEAVSNIGGIPIFVDVEPVHLTIDVNKLEAAITKKTKAIIPVHLYGHPCDMTAIMKIAKAHNLKVLEDCAQAHDAEWNGQKVGTIGDAGSFSFFPGKNLGAYGDAGAMVTNDPDLAEQAKMIARHGQSAKKHTHYIEGRNSRMDSLQAAILRAKLPFLDHWTQRRIEIASEYDRLISNEKIVLPQSDAQVRHVYHLYVIKAKNRDKLKDVLTENNISSAIHYPTALPFQLCYSDRTFTKDDFPVAHKLTNEILSIPIYPELSDEMIKKVVNVLNDF
jgi:dTDP-4-amino-4,6-dideoxygalactose transaminase